MGRRASVHLSPLVAALLAALLLLCLDTAPGSAASTTALLVSFTGTADMAAAAALLNASGLGGVEKLGPLPIYRVLAEGDPSAVIARLRADPLVRAVERDGEQVLTLIPNDDLYRSVQWNLRRIGMEQAWNLRPSAPEIVVAVLDTGVDLTHPDLQANLFSQGFNFLDNTPGAQDDESHGTAIAGIVGAVGNNGQGVTGVAWKVKILPVKALSASGRGPDSAMVKAITYAVDQGARILNISSTGSRYSLALEQAVAYAREKGALVVAAAGNTGDQGNELTYPAAFEGVLAVGAIDERDQVAAFSQRQAYVGISAPGVDVPSTIWRGAGLGPYGVQSGTSIASPHVAGVAALLWTLRPDLLADEIINVLKSSADDLGPPGPDPGYGAGVLNAARAVSTVRLGLPPSAERVSAQAPAPVETPLPRPTADPAAARAKRWYFAEGSTNPPFDAWFALQNPNPTPAQVRFTFLGTDGKQTMQDVSVAANGRASLYANEVLPNAEFATIVSSDLPVYAERSMYFGHDGTAVSGTSDPSTTWYLAEGSTAAGFDTWLLLMNPGPRPARATLRFMREDGSLVERSELIPPMGRTSVYVNQLFTASGFATEVQADQPIVVERAMYFDNNRGGHATMATAAPAKAWYLADGGSRNGFDTWLLIQNPGSAPAIVRFSFLTDDGRVVPHTLTVAPRSRASLYTNPVVPSATYGVTAESDQPIVLERAIYFDNGRAGDDSAASPSLATEWFFPEGSTSGSFIEQLLVLNPQPQAATIQVEFRRQNGEVVPPQTIRVGPNSRATVDVNPFAPDASVALRVTSDRPIMAERSLYFARPTGLGATNSIGLTR